MTGQLAGRWYSSAATQIHDTGSGRQQAGGLRHPPGVTDDVFSRRSRGFAIIAAVSQRNGVVAAADKVALPSPPRTHHHRNPSLTSFPAAWAIVAQRTMHCHAAPRAPASLRT